MREPQAWPLFSHAVWKVVCGSTVGFHGALVKELKTCSQGLQQEHVHASAPPSDAGVSARLTLMSELDGPTLAALEADLMCVSVRRNAFDVANTKNTWTFEIQNEYVSETAEVRKVYVSAFPCSLRRPKVQEKKIRIEALDPIYNKKRWSFSIDSLSSDGCHIDSPSEIIIICLRLISRCKTFEI